MSVPLNGSSKRGLSALFGNRKRETFVKPTAKKQLDGSQLARLFDKNAQAKPEPKPAGLQLSEIHDRNDISALRKSLYSK